MSAERPRPCACALGLLRSLLFQEGGDFTALVCCSCGAVVAYHSLRAFSEQPHVDPSTDYQPLALAPTVASWLSRFPRYLPYTSPSVFLPAEGTTDEAEARRAQAPLSIAQRLELVGVPAPNDDVTEPSLAPFQAVARLISSETPFAELLTASARGGRLVADIATEKLAARPTLAEDFAELIRAGSIEASRAFFRLRPSDTKLRLVVAAAIAERLTALCKESPFAVEAELSEHVLALATLGADAEPARSVLPALRESRLFDLRSTLRDQVEKLERALG